MDNKETFFGRVLKKYEDKFNYKILVILLIAVLSRSILLGQYPGGIHADEAFAGYEAYSLANYGIDSWGYTNPVYLSTWGSGMSALETYLMIPFIACFGLNTVTVKIPNVLLGILTVYVFWLLLIKIANRKIAYWGAFLLAISPWHIMTSRYGMDCNIAPAFICFGIYFAVCGIEKKSYLLISAVFWGLSLYAYAVNWLFVPVFLIGCLIYCIRYKKFEWSWNLICTGIIIFLFALPLLLFVAVNLKVILEIKSSFISIPMLVVWRGNEITLHNIGTNLAKLLKLFFTQNDYLIWNSIREYGIYYLYSTPLVIYGGVLIVKKCIDNFKHKKFGYELIIVWWIIAGVIASIIQRIGINRINFILLAEFILLANGISNLCDRFKRHGKYIAISVYLVSFLLFEICYFTRYQEEISDKQNAGADEAIEYALEISEREKDIYVVNTLRHSQVLFYTQYPTSEYLASVKWGIEEDINGVAVKRFGIFCWDWDVDAPGEGVYIILAEDAEKYQSLGYDVTIFNSCAVAQM